MGSKPPDYGRCQKCGGELAAIVGAGATELLCVRCDTIVPMVEGAIGGAPRETSGAAEGCAACSSPDIRYVLITDGPKAFTRMSFCSVDCLARNLGLVRASTSA